MFSFLHNIPQVTKNILLLNIVFFVATLVLRNNGIYLVELFGGHYINSPLFEPYQIVTHFFMHSDTDYFHIIMNMFVFVMFGALLEKIWGPKRFFIFYVASAIGAFLLYNAIGMYQIYQLKQSIPSSDLSELDMVIRTLKPNMGLASGFPAEYYKYINYCRVPMVGASGAIFGVTAAFAILFPNTELYIYGAFPVKAKYLVGGYFVYELLKSFKGSEGDHVAHLAHVGGAITGAIIVYFWRKKDKKNFW